MLAVRSGVRVVTRVLEDAARAHPDQTAVRFDDADFTYAELWSRARRSAAALR